MPANFTRRAAMSGAAGAFIGAPLLASVLGSCSTMSETAFAQTPETDPYLWLEDVESERALNWVRAQNARSLGALEADPRFAPLLQDALAIANSQDRLPLGQVREGYLYNFWQDADARKRSVAALADRGLCARRARLGGAARH